MDTKPIRELIEAAKAAMLCAKIDGDPAWLPVAAELQKTIAAAERILAGEKPYQDPIFHLDPSTNVVTALPAEIGEALRVADELSAKIKQAWKDTNEGSRELPFKVDWIEIVQHARAYRKARSLEIPAQDTEQKANS